MKGFAAYFSPDYATSRRRFREGAERLGWVLETHPLDLIGPQGEDLSIDIAISPNPAPEKVLVLSSGLHGVEGFFGSAVQVGLFDQWFKNPESAPGSRCVMMHALNPFGFAWIRRFDQNNVDLGRNFLESHQSYTGSPPGYEEVDPILNPESPPSDYEFFFLKAMYFVLKHGMPMLKQAIAGGQYQFPAGLFFGGNEPAGTHRFLKEHLPRLIEGSREVVHLDFHTGLGSWGGDQLLIDYPLKPELHDQLTRWFGRDAFQACDTNGISYSTRGGFGKWCVDQNPGTRYLYMCAEFGTYRPLSVLTAMRAENRAHHWGKPNDRATLRAKQELLEVFCPKSESWRETVLTRSFELVARSIHGLRETL